MTKRILIVGEAPGRQHGFEAPFEGPSGGWLDFMFGSSKGTDEWRDVADARNMLVDWPGSAGPKGALFSVEQARANAVELMLWACGRGYGRILLAGKRVARAFLLPSQVEYFRKHEVRWGHHFTIKTPFSARTSQTEIAGDAKGAMAAYVIPHPSGVNRWWNEASNRHEARQFGKRITRVDATPNGSFEVGGQWGAGVRRHGALSC